MPARPWPFSRSTWKLPGPRELGFPLFALGSLAIACGAAGVGTSSMAVLGQGVVNDPSNKTLRFDILKYGLDEFCREMTERGVPLKLRDDEPILGRFFAEGCQSQVLEQEDRQSFVVQFSGQGYGWTNLTGRLGFRAAGLVEYAPDFQLHDGAMYVYFRPRKVDATTFQLLLTESLVAKAGMAVLDIQPEMVGRDIVQNQLKRGFTVIRYSSTGETDFGMGTIPKGLKPFMPFTVEHSERVTLANARTEVHSGQQDFVGGFRVPEEGSAISVLATVDGADAIDVFLIAKVTGQPMLNRFITAPGPAELTTSPLLAGTIRRGSRFESSVLVPPGSYYLFIDHSSVVGTAAPLSAVGGAAKVDYVVQLGDAP